MIRVPQRAHEISSTISNPEDTFKLASAVQTVYIVVIHEKLEEMQ